MYAGRVSWWVALSMRRVPYWGEKKGGTDRRTDGQTPDRYITLTARRGQRDNLTAEITTVC